MRKHPNEVHNEQRYRIYISVLRKAIEEVEQFGNIISDFGGVPAGTLPIGSGAIPDERVARIKRGSQGDVDDFFIDYMKWKPGRTYKVRRLENYASHVSRDYEANKRNNPRKLWAPPRLRDFLKGGRRRNVEVENVVLEAHKQGKNRRQITRTVRRRFRELSNPSQAVRRVLERHGKLTKPSSVPSPSLE